MEELEDDFIIDEEGYTINSEGSSFHHCTPDCLGPNCNRILALDYSRMMITRIEVAYHWLRYEGMTIPSLILHFRSTRNDGDIYFAIRCRFDSSQGGGTDTILLPDINEFTPYTESFYSMEIEYYSNFCPSYNRGCEYSTIILQDNSRSFKINCFSLEFMFED